MMQLTTGLFTLELEIFWHLQERLILARLKTVVKKYLFKLFVAILRNIVFKGNHVCR